MSDMSPMTSVVALRLTPEEREILEQIAERRGVTVSELMRRAAQRMIRRVA